MPKQIGLVKVFGTLDGTTFYQRNGKNFVRMSKGPSKSMIESSPKFKEFRERRTEFSGSMKLVRSLRKCFSKTDKTMFDNTFAVRAGKVFRSIISEAPGVRVKRPVDVQRFGAALAGFEGNVNRLFEDIVKEHLTPVTTADATRTTLTLTLPAFDISSTVVFPEQTDSFRLFHLAGVLSRYNFDTKSSEYVAVDKVNDNASAITYSDYMPMTGAAPALNLVTKLDGAVLDATSAVISAIGIQFYYTSEGEHFPTTKNGAFRILKTF